MLPTAFARASGTQIAPTDNQTDASRNAIIVHLVMAWPRSSTIRVISDYDLRQRMALFLATSGRPAAAGQDGSKSALRSSSSSKPSGCNCWKPSARTSRVSPADVDKAINNIVNENNLTTDQLAGDAGAGRAWRWTTLRAQIAAQIAWQKTVEDRISATASTVSTDEVDAELARVAKARTSRIFSLRNLPVGGHVRSRTPRC